MWLISFCRLFVEVCLPIFVCVGAGWGLDRRFRFHLETLVKLNIYLMVPSFIFVHVVDTKLAGHDAVRIMAFTANHHRLDVCLQRAGGAVAETGHEARAGVVLGDDVL